MTGTHSAPHPAGASQATPCCRSCSGIQVVLQEQLRGSDINSGKRGRWHLSIREALAMVTVRAPEISYCRFGEHVLDRRAALRRDSFGPAWAGVARGAVTFSRLHFPLAEASLRATVANAQGMAYPRKVLRGAWVRNRSRAVPSVVSISGAALRGESLPQGRRAGQTIGSLGRTRTTAHATNVAFAARVTEHSLRLVLGR